MSSHVIVIHVGQAGVQIGNSVWELLCIEHGVSPDGDYISESDNNLINVFFQEIENKKCIPRVIFLDSEPTVIDEIRSGVYKQLFHPRQLISGKEDAANNYARGSFISGKTLMKPFRSTFLKLMEESDNPQNIIFFDSVGGGSGSGVGALLLQQIKSDCPKVFKFEIPVHPSPSMTTAVVEPYNAVLHVHATAETKDMSMIFDNEALYVICQNLLFLDSPTYTDLNRLLALIVSSITSSIRFQGSVRTGLNEIYTNLIPYPQIHYPIVCHAPVHCESRSCYTNFTVEQITKDVFSKSHQTINCNVRRGKNIAVMLSYNGFLSPNEVSSVIFRHKKDNSSFVDWIPTGFKLSINNRCRMVAPDSGISYSDKAVTMICNTTAVREIWLRLARKFDLLFNKRSFIHWYINDGMEESEFNESVMDMYILSEDYEEISMSESEIRETFDKFPQRKSRSMSLKIDI